MFPTPMPSFVPADPVLGTVLRRLRKERGETQEDIAFGSDLAAGTISKIERGKMDPAWSTVRSIAHAMDLSLEELGREIDREH
jgi:transcriptional regulator with XRE-family HTH domain